MNKLLLSSLFIIIYSASTNAIVDLSNRSIEELIHLSGKKHLPACFYSEDNFQGEYFCLIAPEMIDLYNTENKHFNDKITSISIPQDVQVTVYKNDRFNSPHYNLTESANLAELEKIDMAGNISAIKAFESPFFCAQDCVVIKENKIKLDNIFGHYPDLFGDINNFVLTNVNINKNSNFSVSFMAYPQVVIIGKDLFFYTTEKREPLHMKLNDNTDNLSLLFKLNGHQLQFQYLEAKATMPLNIPFWINTKYSPEDAAELYITNGVSDNDQGLPPEDTPPLILNKTIMAINKHSHRDKRGTLGIVGCIGIPLLAIYNYVVHGHCNQLDKLVGINEFSHSDGAGKTLVVAGTAPLLPVPEEDSDSSLDNPAPSMLVLTHLNTNMHDQALTLPAAAQTCKTTLEATLSARYPRQIGIRCGSRLSNLLADFTLLFGGGIVDWTIDNLARVVQQINEHGTTGYAGSDQETEDRLVRGVQDAINIVGIEPLIEMLMEAFNYTILNYALYLIFNESQETLASPRVAQDLPLGDYILPLEHYTHPAEPPAPRIRDNDQWFTPEGLYFEITVIPGGDQNISTNLTNEIAEVTNNWHRTYSETAYESDHDGAPLTSRDRTIYAARATSHILSNLLQDNTSNYQFVVVKLKGKIISVLASRNDDNGEDSYISFSVTDPRYVLHPQENGSVRGAGSAAVRELARYLKEKGKKILRSQVISQPSAIVKKKLGFHHQEL
ncbi:GNAT family protein [Yersinia frederiksenii]|uniref:GNAT family N-acetyltransferase n=1 Tax=Yersinia frederiksenii TaxID=29484 RepID=UPI0011A0B347|nr:GNAT family N-acetyltransferase [Yersinia frederiksenii]